MNFLNWYGPQAQLVVTDTKHIKEILNNEDDGYPKIDLEGYAKKLLADGLPSSKGEKWVKMGKLANHVFHGESLKSTIALSMILRPNMFSLSPTYVHYPLQILMAAPGEIDDGDLLRPSPVHQLERQSSADDVTDQPHSSSQQLCSVSSVDCQPVQLTSEDSNHPAQHVSSWWRLFCERLHKYFMQNH
ncbi:unnamed protein product [Ilex paraguariensis]|uniref:Uncharacterized protein n=1 Tax=Ilex paraguariensis TaxID=185542 RepID=A0ABC8RFX1_9AQUA